MQLNEKLEVFTDSLKEYADTNFELIKLKVIEQSSSLISGFVATIVISILGFLFAIFGSFYLSFYLSDLLEINYIGFAIVSGFYLLLTIVVCIFKKDLIVKRVCENLIIKIMANKPQTATK